jgi:hypothetical protein
MMTGVMTIAAMALVFPACGSSDDDAKTVSLFGER